MKYSLLDRKLEATIRKNLCDARLKTTLPRVKILQILSENAQQYLDATQLQNKLAEDRCKLGLSSLYRALRQLEEADLIRRSNFDAGRSAFKVQDTCNEGQMICTDTGKVIKFNGEELLRIRTKIAQTYGYEICDHNLTIFVKSSSAKSSTR